jgi:hypothetical protein
MILMFFILILRPIELVVNTGIAVLSFVLLLIISPLSILFILGNGGYVFLTGLAVMLTVGVLRYRGVLRDAVLTEAMEKSEEIEKLNRSLEASLKEKETLL